MNKNFYGDSSNDLKIVSTGRGARVEPRGWAIQAAAAQQVSFQRLCGVGHLSNGFGGRGKTGEQPTFLVPTDFDP